MQRDFAIRLEEGCNVPTQADHPLLTESCVMFEDELNIAGGLACF